ncbi:glycosyltransferase [Paenibacillus sp. P96]|uniref:Glycosyltransferase n=1 Tax=Paenibacillus zeirhizosphaerae TaxID=2987519 RepID=A0ABT9FUT6_9BACL|nr:glycosyltransferase [Paenibacillus sp. P96]MDP4098489.1 glycosyltransferase [Paenibacillus sp. P96]
MMLFSHVSNAYTITGAERLLLRFCQEISAYFDCVLVAPEEGRVTAEARKRGIDVEVQLFPLIYNMYTPYAGLEHEVEQLRNDPYFENIMHLIRVVKPDLVLTNTCVNVLPAMAAQASGIPVVWKITEMIRSNEHTAEAVRLIDRYSDWIIGISNTVLIPLRAGLPEWKTSVIEPSRSITEEDLEKLSFVREKKRAQMGLKGSHFCVGYISSFIYEAKGLLYFVEMALKLCGSFPQCRFWIIGKPSDSVYYTQCISMIRQSGYAKRFLLTTFEASLTSMYGAMDAVVVPSMVEEGFGLTALEGLMFGRPVVAFAQGGLAELMQQTGNEEFLVEPGNSDGLVASVARFISNPEECRAIGWRNRQEASRIYGPGAYRGKLKAMVERWTSERPEWFDPQRAGRPAGEGGGQSEPPAEAEMQPIADELAGAAPAAAATRKSGRPARLRRRARIARGVTRRSKKRNRLSSRRKRRLPRRIKSERRKLRHKKRGGMKAGSRRKEAVR